MKMIKTNNLKLCYDEKIILDDINIEIEKGKITALIGPNGCGKSTLIKSISKILTPKSGEVLMGDKNLLKMPPKELAKELAMLPQSSSAPEDLTIYDLVKQGRYPYHNLLSFWSKKDEEIVMESIRKMGLIEEKDRTLENLSGGQRQRAWIALSLCQDTEVILLDEPTNHLDIKYQIEIMNIVKELNITVLAALHDMNLVSAYCNKVYMIDKGKVVYGGETKEVLTPKNIKDVFGVECEIGENSKGHITINFLF